MYAIKTVARVATAAAAAAVMGLGSMALAPAPEVAATKTAAPMQSNDGYNRRVRIHNQTGWTMLRFYASDTRQSSWQEDILGSGVLGAGRSITINIDDGSGACIYDFRAEFTNGQVLERRRINVCQIADYYYTR